MGGASTQARMDHGNAFVYAPKADFVGHPHRNSDLYGDGSDPLISSPDITKRRCVTPGKLSQLTPKAIG